MWTALTSSELFSLSRRSIVNTISTGIKARRLKRGRDAVRCLPRISKLLFFDLYYATHMKKTRQTSSKPRRAPPADRPTVQRAAVSTASNSCIKSRSSTRSDDVEIYGTGYAVKIRDGVVPRLPRHPPTRAPQAQR